MTSRERAVAVVVVERVAAVVGDVEVLEAVVVVVADRDAHAVAVLRHAGEAGLLRDVGEGAVGVLVVEAVPELRGRTCPGRLPSGMGSSIFAPFVKKMSSRPSLS